MNTSFTWIIFCPQLPATPSSPRVTLWRRMRSYGAISLNNGVWVLLDSDPAAVFIRDIAEYVHSQGGTSSRFLATALDKDTEAEILQRFMRDRAEDYAELKDEPGFSQGDRKGNTAKKFQLRGI